MTRLHDKQEERIGHRLAYSWVKKKLYLFARNSKFFVYIQLHLLKFSKNK